MGLDDVARPVGSVTSDADSLEVGEGSLEWLAAHEAFSIETLLVHSNPSESEIRLLIEILDRVIQNEVEGVKVTEENRSHAEEVRQDLIQRL